MYCDIQEVCGSSSSGVEVCQGALGCNCCTDFLPDAKYFSVIIKSAFTDILGKVAWSHSCLVQPV